MIILCANALLYFNTIGLDMRPKDDEEVKS